MQDCAAEEPPAAIVRIAVLPGEPLAVQWWQVWYHGRSRVRRHVRRHMGRLLYQDVPSPWWWSRPAPPLPSAWIPDLITLPRYTAMWPSKGWHFDASDDAGMLETWFVPLGERETWSLLHPPVIFGLHRFGCPPSDFPNHMLWKCLSFGCCFSPLADHFGAPPRALRGPARGPARECTPHLRCSRPRMVGPFAKLFACLL